MTTSPISDFLAAVKPDGAYAILVTQTVGMRWVTHQIEDGAAGIMVDRGRGRIVWPNGAVAALLSIWDDKDFNKLRGTVWDGVLLVYGDPAYHFPLTMHQFLQAIRRGPDFKTFTVTY